MGLPVEIDGDSIPTTDHDCDALTGLWLVASGEQSRRRGAAAGFADDAEHVPERTLRRADRLIRDQHDVGDVIAGNRENLGADLLRRERIRSDAARLGIDRLAG